MAGHPRTRSSGEYDECQFPVVANAEGSVGRLLGLLDGLSNRKGADATTGSVFLLTSHADKKNGADSCQLDDCFHG